jgi:nucleoside-diphosphate-sugar epimerase
MAETAALVCGAGGFIGSHLVKALKKEGHWVRGVDLKFPEFSETAADDFVVADLRKPENCRAVVDRRFAEVYQLAADMGGAGYLFTGDNDSHVMHNSAMINLNILESCVGRNIKRIFYASSACVYPAYNQADPDSPLCREDTVYPAQPDSEYGWEKLFSERLYLSYARNFGICAKIGRYHNIFGPEGTWRGGKEKAPAALCRKVAEAREGDAIEIWGDGQQTRSFLYIDECVEATLRLMRHPTFHGPVNIGSEEMVSINRLVAMIKETAGKHVDIAHVPGPEGVRGRNSDNSLIHRMLDWRPSAPLEAGLAVLYPWIEEQVRERRNQFVPLAA